MSNPLFLKSASVTIDSVDYDDLISNVVFTPTTSALEFKGVSGKVSTSTGSTVWAVTFDYAQSFDTAGSLALKLFNDEGEKVTVVFKPEAAGAASVTATVTLLSGSFGGAVDAASTSSVTLPVDGKPVIVPASA